MNDQTLETYFAAIKEDFNHMDERFDRIEGRLDKMDGRFDRIENLCFLILEVVRGYDVKFKDHDQRLSRLERKAI